MNDDSIFPDVGQHVKCLLVNNTLAEGFVMIWDPKWCIKLKSLDSESVFIIHHPDRDIVMTKVILDPEPEEIPEKLSIPPEPEGDLEKQWEKTLAGPSDDELRIKKLAELRVLMAEQDKRIIKERIRSHHPGSAYAPRKPIYQQPNLNKIKLPRSAYVPGKLPGR